jgi:hypothetical protein
MNSDWRKDYIRYKSYFSHVVSQYKSRADLKAYLEMFLSLVTISVFTIFALRPTLLTIAQLVKDIETKKETVTRMDKKIATLSQARSQFDQEQVKIAVLESAIPKSGQPDIFSRQVEGLVGSHQLATISFTVGKSTILQTGPKAEAPPETTPLPEGAEGMSFTLNTEADLADFSKLSAFLADFEKLRMPLVLEEIQITSGQALDAQGAKLLLFIRGEAPYILYQ